VVLLNLGDLVTGAVVSVRPKADRIGLWISDSEPAESVVTIGKMLKTRLRLEPQNQLNFEGHEDTRQKSGSTAKSRYAI
jgi:hypothetical protein